MRRGPGGAPECLRDRNVHVLRVIARIPNVLPSRTMPAGYYPPTPTLVHHPGYTPAPTWHPVPAVLRGLTSTLSPFCQNGD